MTRPGQRLRSPCRRRRTRDHGDLSSSITSVARQMPSTSECRQPGCRTCSVTESFTLMAGNNSEPSPSSGRGGAHRWWSLGDTEQALGCGATCRRRRARRQQTEDDRELSLSAVDGSGTAPARSNSTPCARAASRHHRRRGSCSGRCCHCRPPATTVRSVHHQYPRRLPFQANPMPAAAMAAAWSWVEKMLQDAQRTRHRARPGSR